MVPRKEMDAEGGAGFPRLSHVLLGLLLLVVLFNQYQMGALSAKQADWGAAQRAANVQGAAQLAASTGGAQSAGGASAQLSSAQASSGTGAAAVSVVPTGVPPIYGEELGISYDDVSPNDPQRADATIAKLANYDMSLKLEGDKLSRYIAVGSAISCEYCCGAKSIIFSNGEPACGCAHSYAMRGLAKYLLTDHAGEFTDLQILEELGKWKVLFFPGIHEQKAAVLQSQGIEVNYITLASNAYRGIEQGASGGSMVGGC